MSTEKPIFDVDKAGLAKLLAGRGKSFAMLELIQNALDENVTKVVAQLAPLGMGRYIMMVEDDSPEGFHDIRHAFTFFAESKKKNDPTKRGRFNLGEKLVIAVCDKASIATTTGTVEFSGNTRIEHPRRKRDAGSRFTGELRMTKAEYEETLRVVQTVLVPEGIEVLFNDQPLKPRRPLKTFEDTILTIVANDEGHLIRSNRRTTFELHPVLPGETAHIYELGIPVVDTQLDWHVNVGQKVPLNSDRDNITPAWKRTLFRMVVEATHDELTPEQTASEWVRTALADPKISDDAVESIVTTQFGEKRVIKDPFDPEANKIAVSKGYALIEPHMFRGKQWANIKSSGAALPAGRVTPSPKPYSDDPDAPPVHVVEPKDYTPAQVAMVAYARELHEKLIDRMLTVRIVRTTNNFGAAYGGRTLDLNVRRLGHAWFEAGPSVRVDDLLIHEFGHYYCGDHLSDDYYKALTKLGARMVKLALDEPRFFRKHMRKFEALKQPKAVAAS